MNLLKQLESLKLNEEKAALFTNEGELIWRSPAWGHKPEHDSAVLGSRWHEFVMDLPAVLAWFKDESTPSTSFRCLLPSSGKIAIVTYTKIPFMGHWLVFGECSPTEETMPAPPCMIAEPNNPQL